MTNLEAVDRVIETQLQVDENSMNKLAFEGLSLPDIKSMLCKSRQQ